MTGSDTTAIITSTTPPIPSTTPTLTTKIYTYCQYIACRWDFFFSNPENTCMWFSQDYIFFLKLFVRRQLTSSLTSYIYRVLFVPISFCWLLLFFLLFFCSFHPQPVVKLQQSFLLLETFTCQTYQCRHRVFYLSLPFKARNRVGLNPPFTHHSIFVYSSPKVDVSWLLQAIPVTVLVNVFLLCHAQLVLGLF